MRLSIIILSYNTQELTKQCLQSLQDVDGMQLGQDFEVVVVDNGSSDESVSMIKSKFPQVKMIETGENSGFSKGNNIGVGHIDPESKYVLFLNPDTVVPSGTLSEMVRFMDVNVDVGLSTCKVELWSGGLDWDCHRGFPTPWVSLTRLLKLNKLFPHSKILNGYNQGWKDLDSTHDVDVVVGAFMLVRRKIGEKVGWFDEDYFLNGEDIDFCYRVRQSGNRVTYHPQVSITHYRGASKGTRKESSKVTTASQAGKKRVTGASVDAMQIFYDKHYRDQYPWILNILINLGLKSLRWKRLRALSIA